MAPLAPAQAEGGTGVVPKTDPKLKICNQQQTKSQEVNCSVATPNVDSQNPRSENLDYNSTGK